MSMTYYSLETMFQPEIVKSWLGKSFSMKDLGEAAYILGIKIYRDRSRRLLGLSQSTYLDKVLNDGDGALGPIIL